MSSLVLVALLHPTWWLGFVVCLGLLIAYALDSADGQLARLVHGASKSGEYLDHLIDAAKVCVLHSVVLISWYRFSDASGGQLLIPLGFQLTNSVFFFSIILVEQLQKGSPLAPNAMEEPDGWTGILRSLVALPNDYAVLCLCFAFLGWERGFIVTYTALFALNALILCLALIRWWRRLRAIDRAG
jgi:phosphatidylglycerophosphate synthase